MQTLIKYKKYALIPLMLLALPICTYIIKAIFNLGVISGTAVRLLSSIC